MHRTHNIIRLLAFALILAMPAAAMAKPAPESFADLAARAGKAVVNISTVQEVQGGGGLRQFQQQLPDGHPFQDFFDQFEQFFGGRQGPPRQQSSLGSGFIISKDGLVVTNNHVIEKADEVSVLLQDDETEYEAEIIGRDPETDLALLRIKADKDLPVLEFGDSDHIEVGDWVVAIGNPFGLGHTVTAGIISAKGRVIHAGPFDDFLQTDASINPGNSGGPLIDMDGKVVGINTAIVASGQGIGFAIPSAMAGRIIEQLKTGKKVRRGWLGVTIQDLDENTAKALGLPQPTGALVNSVMPGDAADKAGLKVGDVILEVNGHEIGDTSDLLKNIATLKPGEKARMVIWRDGKERTLTARLGERDVAKLKQQGPGGQPQEQTSDELGITMRSVQGADEARALGLDSPMGLVVTNVEPGSPAAKAGLLRGDVILEVNQEPVDATEEFRSAVDKAADAKGVVMLLVKRQGRNIFRTIPLEGN